jgi:hypothetical protein
MIRGVAVASGRLQGAVGLSVAGVSYCTAVCLRPGRSPGRRVVWASRSAVSRAVATHRGPGSGSEVLAVDRRSIDAVYTDTRGTRRHHGRHTSHDSSLCGTGKRREIRSPRDERRHKSDATRVSDVTRVPDRVGYENHDSPDASRVPGRARGAG